MKENRITTKIRKLRKRLEAQIRQKDQLETRLQRINSLLRNREELSVITEIILEDEKNYHILILEEIPRQITRSENKLMMIEHQRSLGRYH